MSNKSIRVAIIGCGICGISAAASLQKSQIPFCLFDMGRMPGGRSCSRISRDDPETSFDHGCQSINPQSPEFSQEVALWEAAGLVKKWHGKFIPVCSNDTQSHGFCGVNSGTKYSYVGVPSMGSLHESLLRGMSNKSSHHYQSHKVTKVEWIGPEKRWQLYGKDHEGTEKNFGSFEYLICADALPFVEGSPGYIGLQDSHVPAEIKAIAQNIGSIPYQTLFILMIKTNGKIDSDFGASYRSTGDKNARSEEEFGIEAFQWIARNNSKPCRKTTSSATNTWVAITTSQKSDYILEKYPMRNSNGQIIPQTKEYKDKIAEYLIGDFVKAYRMYFGKDEIVSYNSQRWGRAFCLDQYGWGKDKCVDVMKFGFVACGDYFIADKKITPFESSWVSGKTAAEKISDDLKT